MKNNDDLSKVNRNVKTVEGVAKLGNSGVLRDFSCEANKHKNGKCLGVTFLCFLCLPAKKIQKTAFPSFATPSVYRFKKMVLRVL